MCANSEGSGETARMRSLAWAFAVRLCDKYYNLMSRLIYAFIKETLRRKMVSDIMVPEEASKQWIDTAVSAMSATVCCEIKDHGFELHILNFWKIVRRMICVQV